MDYRLRWGIETLFATLKTRGFNLESTHFCHAERLSKLMALLALAFCWAMLAGLWQHQQQAPHAAEGTWASGEEPVPLGLRLSAAHLLRSTPASG